MDVKMNPSIVNTNNKLADDCSSTIDDQNTCTSPKRRRSETFQPDFDSLPFDVQEEIECLYEFVPEVEHHFTVLNKIGEGTFSSVFLARLKHYPDMQQMFALKHIIPTSHPSRIEGELQCLQEIGGCDNVMGVELCIRNRDHVVIVMPYFPHEKFQDYLLYMSVPEVRDYMKNLLIALRRVHKFNIIHRDVKPSNFLYHRTTQQYTLVDFGLAHKVSVTQKTKSSHSPQCRTDTSKSSSNRKPLSPSKKHLQAQNLQNLSPSSLKKTEHVVSTQENLKNEEIAECKKLQQFTTPTPDLNNRLFTKKVKSPRRLLLAKRAILLKERETTTKDTKDRVSLTKTNPGLSTCQCYGKAQVCTICTARNNQQAPRAGTPGFRSPEVLLKCPDQTTAVDIWSAGVIFLSLLSGRYPFFRANDDMTALAQIISILGSEEVVKSAESYGKQLICNPSTKPLPMKNLCARLRSGPMAKSRSHKGDNSSTKENEATKSWSELPDSAYDLLSKLMDLNPYTRISANEALKHEFFTATS